MSKEEVLKDISALIGDIDKCTASLVRAKTFGDDEGVEYQLSEMGRLMAAAHHELSFLYGHIKTLYELKKKADEVYFRAGNLSADMNSAKALREAREDYWHYVNYELLKEGGKE